MLGTDAMLPDRQAGQQRGTNGAGLGRNLSFYFVLDALSVINQMLQISQIPGSGLILADIQKNEDRFIHTGGYSFSKKVRDYLLELSVLYSIAP